LKLKKDDQQLVISAFQTRIRSWNAS